MHHLSCQYGTLSGAPLQTEHPIAEATATLHHPPRQVDVVPAGPNGEKACAVNYFREGASFMEAPVSPVGPVAAP